MKNLHCRNWQKMAEKITPKKSKAIVALMTASTIPEAAKLARVGERTLYTWLKNAAFQAELKHWQADYMQGAARRLVVEVDKAITIIKNIMMDDQVPPAVRLRAAESIVANALKLGELVDLAERVTELEAISDD
jgi:uncharacterized protein (UPF0147 family)